MFYIPTILGRKGPLAKLWLAAHDGGRLSRAQIMEVDVPAVLALFTENTNIQTSLRLQGDLLVGVSYITKRQTDYMMELANRTIRQIATLLPLASLESGERQQQHLLAGIGTVAHKGPREVAAAVAELTTTVEPVFDFEAIQRNFEELINEYPEDQAPTAANAAAEMSAEEWARLHQNVTMEDNVYGAGELTADLANHTDDLGGPIDQDQLGKRAASTGLNLADGGGGTFNITGQSLSEISRVLKSATEREEGGPPTATTTAAANWEEDMQVDHLPQDTLPPPIDRTADTGEPARKRLRPDNLIPAVEPSSLVLEELNQAQIAAARRRRPRRGGPPRPRLVLPPAAAVPGNPNLIIDYVIRIPDDVFRAQIAPTAYQQTRDFPVIADTARYPSWDALLKAPGRQMANGLLRRLYQDKVTAAAHGLPAVLADGEEGQDGLMAEDEDAFLPPIAPEDQEGGPAAAVPADIGIAVPPFPQSPVAGAQQQQQPPTDLLDQLPPPAEEHFSDRGDEHGPLDSSTFGTMRRSRTGQLHLLTEDEHAQLETAISAQVTLNLSAMSVAERLPFKRFVSKEGGEGGEGGAGGGGRRAAAMMFVNLLARHDQGEVQLEQEPSYQTFNTLYLRRR